MSEQTHVVPPSCRGPGPLTALHRAAAVGNRAAMAALIQGGCAVDLQSTDGNTALHEVSWHGFSHCVKLLVKTGADVHIGNKAGNTALHLACQNAHAHTARLLLLGGSSPDSKNHVGDSCLHVAARYDNLTLVKILLGSLCSVTERNQAGDTALHVAAALNHKRTVRLLLEAGTDGTITNNAGKRALDEARDNNHRDMAHLLVGAPQVHRFMQRRTIRRRKERLAASCRIQSVTGELILNKPLFKKLESNLEASQEDMRRHILNVQEQVNVGLAQLDQRNRHQIKVLDMLNQERAAAERKSMVYQMEQRAAQHREEARGTQAAVSRELKRWCVSQLKDRDVHIPAKARDYKLLPSSSVERSAAEADLESLPLLSVLSGDSNTSLATHVHVPPCKSTNRPGGPEKKHKGARTIVEMKVDRAPGLISDDIEKTTLFPMPSTQTTDLLLCSVDPLWQPREVQGGPFGAVVPLRGGGFSSSSSSPSSISAQGPRLINNQEHHCDRPDRKHFGELMSAGIHTDGTRTLEFFIDRPAKPTFSQERNNQRAVEVTQRFFDSVSTRLECWYERKVAEMEQQAQLRAQQDTKELLQQISKLEEELQRLQTNESAEGIF
ncbi:ankyrin repeat domain-containing protein 6 [Pungitius pungitius]|uniref:ankyrin repeat domain-containing protein 6 n=1 Tax=Pungitius pungitius TaxID=134920 RepID=UPI002E165DAC